MPTLLHHPEDDDASEASILPGLKANWAGVNDDEEEDVPIAPAGITLFVAACITLQGNQELALDDVNEEEEEEDDIVKEDGNDAFILDNADEHAIKRQQCEEEKRKLIVNSHA